MHFVGVVVIQSAFLFSLFFWLYLRASVFSDQLTFLCTKIVESAVANLLATDGYKASP